MADQVVERQERQAVASTHSLGVEAIRDDDCCDPRNGSFSTKDDGDSCTDDTCSDGGDLGTDEHANSEEGTSCDDGNACTHTDECGDGDGICTGDDINDDTCDPSTNADCVALITGTTCGEDGICECSLNPKMTCEITPGKLPKHAECIGGVNDGGKCTDDNDCPGQVNPPIFAGFCDNQACFHENAKVEAFVRIGSALVAINGFQVTVLYDPSCMQLVSVDPVAPFTQVLQAD
ncbi:MAG: hypothetical protein IIC55_03735 [Proteobacteria bacterium]|nr:hypothetical protein [Pseudomonadota bacterium]